MPVVISASSCAKRIVFCFPVWIVVAKCNKRGGANSDRIGAQRERLRDVRTCSNATGYNKLNLTMHAKILQRLNGGANTGQSRLPDMFNKHMLRRRRAATRQARR